MHLEIAVVGIGFAGQQALQLASSRFFPQPFERCLGIGNDSSLAFGLAELDQFERFGNLPFDPLITADRLIELGALAEQLLCRFRIVPQTRVLRLSV